MGKGCFLYSFRERGEEKKGKKGSFFCKERERKLLLSSLKRKRKGESESRKKGGETFAAVREGEEAAKEEGSLLAQGKRSHHFCLLKERRGERGEDEKEVPIVKGKG